MESADQRDVPRELEDSLSETAEEEYVLCLYVAGQTGKSRVAYANLKRICEEHLTGHYTIEVVDLLENPKLARFEQIFAVPTLVRRLPLPVKKMVGDLSDTERVLVGLNILPECLTT